MGGWFGSGSGGLDATSAFITGGNSFGADAVLGTNDAFGIIIEANNTPFGKVLSTGVFYWGPGTPAAIGTEIARFHKNQNAVTRLRIDNENNGASADAELVLGTGTSSNINATLASRAATLDVLLVSSSAATGGLILAALGTAPTTFCSTNSLTARGKLISTGELIWGDSFTNDHGSSVILQAKRTSDHCTIGSQTLSSSKEAAFSARNSSGLTVFMGIGGTAVGGTRFGISANSLAWVGSNTIAGVAVGTLTAFPLYLCTNDAVQWSVTSAGVLTAEDAKNMAFGTTTGTKIGTATSQKLAFYNATPIVQGASVADASGGAIIDAEARTAINALISRIEATGLIATV